MSKYNARRTIVDGIPFASKAEADRYGELRLMQMAGEIRDLMLQPSFILQEKFSDMGGRNYRAIKYIADFSYRDRAGRDVVEDVKGCETAVYKLKRTLFRKRYPQVLHVEIRNGGQPVRGVDKG